MTRLLLFLTLCFPLAVEANSVFPPDEPGKIGRFDKLAVNRHDYVAVVTVLKIDEPREKALESRFDLRTEIPMKGELPKLFKHCGPPLASSEKLESGKQYVIFARKNPLKGECVTRSGKGLGSLEAIPYEDGSERIKLIREYAESLK